LSIKKDIRGVKKTKRENMRVLKKIKERFIAWFTVSRVIITIWNAFAYCYHYFFIGIDPLTSLILQGTGLIIEYWVAGYYEDLLLWSNEKINDKTIFVKFFFFKMLKRIVLKYMAYVGIFILIYLSTYFLRMGFFYLIDFGVDLQHFERSMHNMIWFTPLAAPSMAIIVIARKKATGKIRIKVPKKRKN
jgi:hypothetical protein